MSEFDARQVVSRRLEEIVNSDTRLLREDGATSSESSRSLLHAMVLGLDDAGPRALSREEIETFGDYFTQQLVLQGTAPLTLAGLDEALRALPLDTRLKVRDLFAVDESAHFLRSVPPFSANTRLVFVWRKDDSSKPDIMLSTVAAPDDPTALMQLIAWSESGGAFHYFERTRDGSGWIWAGNSFHALEPKTRGKGPFDSHINGSVVMKELKFPWVHWHSQADGISREVLFPTPELDHHPLFASLSGAEDLESIVQGGVRRWTDRRLQADSEGGTIEHFKRYARQLVTTTSVNLASSPVSAIDAADMIELPTSFFLDIDGLTSALTELLGSDSGLDLTDHAFSVSGKHYRSALVAVGAHVSEGSGVRVDGDTNFAFTVPERAFEDIYVIRALMQAGVISPRLVLATLMLDFPNPIFSSSRARLLPHFPDRATSGEPSQLDEQVIEAIRAASNAGSPEAEVLRWWDEPDLGGAIRQAVDVYGEAVRARLSDPAGVVDLLRLAEHRRASFRRRPLAEFAQTMPMVDVHVPALQMRADGFVVSDERGAQEP